MFTTTLRVNHKRELSPLEAYQRATPAQRSVWFPHGPPQGGKALEYATGPAGPAWDDGADLEVALAAGRRALEDGYGGVLPGGQAPCGTCPSCVHGSPQHCRRPASKAMARLRSQQNEGDRWDQAEAASAEMRRIVFREEWNRGMSF